MTMSIDQLRAQLQALTPGEKAEVLKLLAAELTQHWSGIDRTPEVCGGAACISRTRIPVWLLVGYRRSGWSEARILENYPALRAGDLANAWAYAAAHVEEIDAELLANEAA